MILKEWTGAVVFIDSENQTQTQAYPQFPLAVASRVQVGSYLDSVLN